MMLMNLRTYYYEVSCHVWRKLGQIRPLIWGISFEKNADERVLRETNFSVAAANFIFSFFLKHFSCLDYFVFLDFFKHSVFFLIRRIRPRAYAVYEQKGTVLNLFMFNEQNCNTTLLTIVD